MRKALGMLAIVAMLAIAVPASAQDFVGAGPNYTGPPGPGPENPPGQYLLDDGTSENSVGLTAGGELAWIHMFRVTPGNNTITSVMAAFGTPAFPGNYNNRPFKVYLWRDPNQDGNPADAQLLTQGAGVVVNANTDTFVKVPITPTNIGAVGTWFGIGASMNQTSGEFPAALDQSSGPHPDVWVAGSGSQNGFNPNNLPGGIGLFRMQDIGLPGRWLLRANAVPEPTTMGLLALGGLALLRRRR